GADGLITYRFDGEAVRMRLFNADGSASEVSGNGVRCLAALVVRDNPGAATVTVDTPAAPKVVGLICGAEGAQTHSGPTRVAPAQRRRIGTGRARSKCFRRVEANAWSGARTASALQAGQGWCWKGSG